jgi:hypothetical protein
MSPLSKIISFRFLTRTLVASIWTRTPSPIPTDLLSSVALNVIDDIVLLSNSYPCCLDLDQNAVADPR